MSSFKEKVMSFLKEKNLETEFILFLADQDEVTTEDLFRPKKVPTTINRDTAKYMGEKHSLKRLLNTVGKKTFVEYYGRFNTNGYLEEITRNGDVLLGSAKAKKSAANTIFKLGMQKEALETIAKSTRVEAWVAEEAKKILNEVF